MGIFYKATRPDGFDFYSRTVNYAAHLASGEPLPEKPQVAYGFECCSSSVYHASTSKADTLIGGRWPCRLFEVEGDPVAEEENKRGFRTLRVVREIDAWQALGPNGKAVVALIERAETLTVDEVWALAAAFVVTWNAAGDIAWGADRDAARDAAWDAGWHAARHAGRRAAWDAVWDAVYRVTWDAGRHATWHTVRSAAGDAVWALVARDLISAEHFTALYGPWAQVISDHIR